MVFNEDFERMPQTILPVRGIIFPIYAINSEYYQDILRFLFIFQKNYLQKKFQLCYICFRNYLAKRRFWLFHVIQSFDLSLEWFLQLCTLGWVKKSGLSIWIVIIQGLVDFHVTKWIQKKLISKKVIFLGSFSLKIYKGNSEKYKRKIRKYDIPVFGP